MKVLQSDINYTKKTSNIDLIGTVACLFCIETFNLHCLHLKSANYW